MVSKSVERLKGTATETAHTVIGAAKDATKGVFSFLDSESEAEAEANDSRAHSDRFQYNQKAERWQDTEDSYKRFVKEEVAMGKVAVGQTVKSTNKETKRRGSNGGVQKKKSLNGSAATAKQKKEIVTQTDTEVESHRLEAIFSGSSQVREAFLMAEQIRTARAIFQRLLEEGEFESIERAYDIEVTKREDNLQDLLIEYSPLNAKGSKSLISQEQQDFIIDYSGGAYNKTAEAQAPKGAKEVAANSTRGSAVASNQASSQNGSGGEGMPPTPPEKSDEAPGQQTITSEEDPDQGVPFERALVPVGTVRDHDLSEEDGSKDVPASIGAAAVLNGHADSDPVASTESEPIEPWSGLGEKENIAIELMKADPKLYNQYVIARGKFMTDQANARGAGLSPDQNTGWKARFRGLVPERFKKSDQPEQVEMEEQEGFESIYDQALRKVIAWRGASSPEEELQHKRDLESDAAGTLIWDIEKTTLLASSERKSSFSRRTAIISGLGIAAVGAVTGAVERLRHGENHGLLLATAAGTGAVFGGVAGYRAAKSEQPKEDEDSIDTNAQAASDAVGREYDSGSIKPGDEKLVGLEIVQKMTKEEKKKRMYRKLGAIGLGVIGGAAVGAGAHWLVDAFPAISSQRGADMSTLQGQPEAPTDQVQAAAAEAVDFIDSDGDGVGDTVDAFPNDSSETVNSDSDGVGDNKDAFPTDPEEWADSDKDGVGNNADAFPYDSSETLNSDRDGVGDNADAFPDNPNEWADSDKDGVGNNQDAFPNDPDETKNSDSDGVGDNADVFPEDSHEWADSDGDGVGDNADVPIAEDTTETEPNPPSDHSIYVEDGSGINNEVDQYVNATSNVDLDQKQLEAMYEDLFGPNVNTPGEYTPSQVFGGVEFYEMRDGQWGMRDVGHATITPVGQEAIQEWVAENV